MATIQTDYEGLKRMSSEFVKAMPTLDLDGLDNGMKCFGLAYLGCDFADDPIGRINREVGGPVLFRLVSRLFMEREAALLSAD